MGELDQALREQARVYPLQFRRVYRRAENEDWDLRRIEPHFQRNHNRRERSEDH